MFLHCPHLPASDDGMWSLAGKGAVKHELNPPSLASRQLVLHQHRPLPWLWALQWLAVKLLIRRFVRQLLGIS